MLKLNAYALAFLLDTLARAVWRRKGAGLVGIVRYMTRMAVYLAQSLTGFFLLTWRVRVILSAYAWFRRVDDVMDDDAAAPNGFSRESYLAQKDRVINSVTHLQGCRLLPEDILIVHATEEARRRQVDITDELRSLWRVMRWDDHRRHEVTVATREELLHYAILQDQAILGLCVRLFGGDMKRFHRAAKLLAGVFTRTDWLTDMPNDLQRGVINIPREALVEHGIGPKELVTHALRGELYGVAGFEDWRAIEIAELGQQWRRVRAILGQDFGGAFSSRILTYVFDKLLVREFEREFERLTR